MVNDRGALEPLVGALAVLLVIATLAIASAWSIAVRLEQAQTGADAAALAAGARDCAVAREVAGRNAVRLDRCMLGPSDVRVRVSLASHAPAVFRSVGVPARLVASARASRVVTPAA